MEIRVFTPADLQVAGIIHLSANGWDRLEVRGGGEALEEAFQAYKSPNAIPLRFGRKYEDETIIRHETYIKLIPFGDEKYLYALDEKLRDYGEFMIFWSRENYEELENEYDKLIGNIGQMAA